MLLLLPFEVAAQLLAHKPHAERAKRAERVGLMRVLARRSVGHGYILKVEIYFFYQTTPESGNEIKKRLD